jgi:phospholipase C
MSNSNTRLKQIKHIVVLMLENRSFDNMLGWLYDPGNKFPFDHVPANFDGVSGKRLCNRLNEHEEFCVEKGSVMTNPNPDPNEGYNNVYAQEFDINPPPSKHDNIPNTTAPPSMGGFVKNYANAIKRYNRCRICHRSKTKPGIIMDGFTPASVPVISGLAYSYAVCDHWYSSVPTETFPNRSYVHAATSSGYVYNTWDFGYLLNKTPTIYNLLEGAGVSWRIYYGSHLLFCDAYVGQEQLRQFATDNWQTNRFFQMEQFYKDAAAPVNATGPDFLPSYSFIEPVFISSLVYGPENDEHPPYIPLDIDGFSNVLQGELLISRVYEHLVNGPNWDSTLFVIIYDEHGGCYDHVAPPAPVDSPDGVIIPVSQPGGSGFDFQRLGVRIPAVLISPLIEERTVCNTAFDHTSIIRTAIECFDIKSNGSMATLLNREANANYVDDRLITRTQPRPKMPPPPPAITPREAERLRAAEAAPSEDKRPLTKFQRDIVKRAAQHLAEHSGKKVDYQRIKLPEHANAALGEQGDRLLRRR